jgi:uncharacterized protein with HEPN domain
MPSKQPDRRLRDIVQNIDRILGFTHGMAFEAFMADERTRLAVERCLLIISEAGRKLGPEVQALAPEIPWHQVRGLGNWLRHDYDQIDHRMLWGAITNDLPKLRAACVKSLER